MEDTKIEIEQLIFDLSILEDRFNKFKNSKAKKPPQFIPSYNDSWLIRQSINILRAHIQILAEKEAVVDFLFSALKGPMEKLIRENAAPKPEYDDF